MSIHHTTIDTRADLLAAPVRASAAAVRTGQTAIVTLVGVVHTALLRRWTHRRFARLSDHMLSDFGFERDRDGAIRTLRDVDRAPTNQED
ncbi:MAG: hypothetical protein J0H34_08505 [Rhizobiales bacterium]|nr:hypothetical protein [Hyphomicrobiales bacterium]